MNKIWSASLFACAISMAPAAYASDKRDFEGCDGRIHPGKQDDGLRGEAAQNSYSFFGGVRGIDIAACTRALASPRLLPTQRLRKAHLLRARAAGYLQSAEIDNAIADLDLAEKETSDLANDRFFRRSLGVSLSLMRALALTYKGQNDGVASLLSAAKETRPYSLQVQYGVAEISQASRKIGDGSPSPWLTVIKLEPAAAINAVIQEAELGNFANALKLAQDVKLEWPTQSLQPYGLLSPNAQTSSLLSSVIMTLHTAYAKAATGDVEGARQDLSRLEEGVAPALATSPQASVSNAQSPARNALKDFMALRRRQIEARIATAEGRTNDALSALVGSGMPRDAATIELLTALRAALPAQGGLVVPDITSFEKDLAEKRRKDLIEIVRKILVAPETPRSVVDYERARPNIVGALIGGALTMGTSLLGGINRTDGFRSTDNADGTTKVEFIGNTPSAALVQEMTLLRAAELAKSAGKNAFVIVDRKDFTRTMQSTRNGMVISSVNNGFKTELTVRYIENTGDMPYAFGTDEVLDSLGPLYYEEARPAKK